MKKLLGASGLLFISACSTEVGLPATNSYSGFDEAAIVDIAPHGAACTTMICTGLGAQWQEAKPTAVILKVSIFNATEAITGAELKMDGEVITLTEMQTLTDFSDLGLTSTTSTQDFVVHLDLIDRILTADRVWLRVKTLHGSHEDAISEGDKKSKAFHALKRFQSEVKAKQGG